MPIIETIKKYIESFNQTAQENTTVSVLVLLIIVILGIFVFRIIHFIFLSLTKKTTKFSYKYTLQKLKAPIELGFVLTLFFSALHFLPIKERFQTALLYGEKGLYGLIALWFSFRLTDAVITIRISKLKGEARISASQILPLVRRVAKILFTLLIALFVLQNYGVDIGALLAGLGIGGLAIALAGQKTVENLFGGITLFLDQPIKVGEVCKFNDTLGIIEDIGLRSTRIRTLDRTVITLPNAAFSEMQIENYTRRDMIRFYTVLGLRYETTPDQMRYVLVELRKLLLAHPKVSEDPARVRLINFGSHSLDVEVYSYIDTSDWNEFLAVREDLMLRIMDIINSSGTDFAFPSQTLYMERGSGIDEQKTKTAEENVKKWQNEGKTYLPDMEEEEIKKIQNTIKYPS